MDGTLNYLERCLLAALDAGGRCEVQPPRTLRVLHADGCAQVMGVGVARTLVVRGMLTEALEITAVGRQAVRA